MKAQKIASEKLVVDFTLYPRTHLESTNIAKLCDAMQAGITLPPIVVDEKSLRVVDGVHRLKAFQKSHKPGVKIDVLLKTYTSDTDMFLDALRLNAAHGSQFTPFDIARNIAASRKMKIAPDVVCSVLSIPKARYDQVLATKMAVGRTGDAVALKSVLHYMAGKRMTKKQEEAQEHLSGMNATFFVNQLLILIESELLDENNEYLIVRAGVLVERLTEWLKYTEVKRATA